MTVVELGGAVVDVVHCDDNCGDVEVFGVVYLHQERVSVSIYNW